MNSKAKNPDVSSYNYQETVIIKGNILHYVKDLEGYFRTSWRDLQIENGLSRRRLDRLQDSVELYKREGLFLCHHLQGYAPFCIHENNIDETLQYLKYALEHTSNLIKAQRINHGRLIGIIRDSKPPETADLVNYSYFGCCVWMKITGKEITMRVFTTNNTRENRLAAGFASYANSIEGVDATVTKEDWSTKPPTLEKFIESGTYRRSPPLVKCPVFTVEKLRDSITYSHQLSQLEMEMLNILGEAIRKPSWLLYDSCSWSPSQGKKIISNLLGILAVQERHSNHLRPWYEWVWIDHDNRKQVQAALSGRGQFSKRVDFSSLAALEYVFSRTLELQRNHKGFYPRFTRTEISNKLGVSREEAAAKLDDLVGVLAPVHMRCMFEKNDGGFYSGPINKYALTRQRMELANQILNT